MLLMWVLNELFIESTYPSYWHVEYDRWSVIPYIIRKQRKTGHARQISINDTWLTFKFLPKMEHMPLTGKSSLPNENYKPWEWMWNND